ncbi:hypothetical protein [Sphaerospermopsis reniformis]|nr:hypothetical protein [Sphaerospermopsis reniformis]
MHHSAIAFGVWECDRFLRMWGAIAFWGCGRAIAVTIKEILEGMKR